MASLPTLEIHVEKWNSALHLEDRMHWSDLGWLMEILKKYNVHPIAYVLEKDRYYYSADLFHLDKEQIKSHGEYHYYDEKADRSPYFNQIFFSILKGILDLKNQKQNSKNSFKR